MGFYGFSGPPSSLYRIPKASDPSRCPIDPNFGDEFLPTRLDADWSFRNVTPSDISIPSTLTNGIRLSGMISGDAIYRPAPGGDFEVVMEMSDYSTYGNMVGISILDSSGAGVGFSPYNTPYAYFMWNVSGWAYSSTGPQGTDLTSTSLSVMRHWMAIKKSGTTYTARVSLDGNNWSSYTSSIVNAFTPAFLAVAGFFAAGGTAVTMRRLNVYFPTYTP